MRRALKAAATSETRAQQTTSCVRLSAEPGASCHAVCARLTGDGVPRLVQGWDPNAALLETSLDTAEVAARLDTPASRVRQLIARRSLYSVLLDGRRHVFAYQFDPDGAMVPGIARVNAALDPTLHPLSVHEWFVEPDAELFMGDDVDAPMSPLDWLRSGGDVARLVALARQL